MSLPAAYLVVVIVWSTTPLGVQWSSEGMSPLTGVACRMLISALLGWLLVLWLRIPVPKDWLSLRVYGISNIGVFAGLLCVYLGAALIPSGLVSVLFGTSPIVSALLARKILREPPLSPSQWAAVLIGTAGMLVVFSDDLQQTEQGVLGMLLVIFGMLCFSLGNVLIKREQVQMHPLAQTVGALSLATVLYGVTGLVVGFEFEHPSSRALASILYLSVFGSLIGFLCYFYILKYLAASKVALVTLMTPALAVLLGAAVNDEKITGQILMGTTLISCGLIWFYWGQRWLIKLGLSNQS